MIASERYRIRDRGLIKRSFAKIPSTSISEFADNTPFQHALDDELTVIRQALQDYEVLERVQQGGQGVVYMARQRGTERIVALKLLLDGPLATEHQRARFAREIELVSRLRHPNIVTVYESGVARGRNFYAMEFVEGLPINDFAILHDMPPRDIVLLVIKICGAVQHAHQNGIIHRDLNPANILIDESGEPRVFDFGLAKDLWAGPEDGGALCTAPGCGTLPYLSPEQAGAGEGRVDVRSDVYAIGLVLYELLTDMFPYPVRGELNEVRTAIMTAEPMPLRKAVALGSVDRTPGLGTINRDLEAILAKALAKAKSERYQSAAALTDDLERWLAGEAVNACTGNRWYVLRKTLRRHRISVGIAATVLAALSVTVASVGVAWARVRVERDSARAAARTAYDLFDMALTDVDDSVRPLAGGVAVRDRLIGRLTDKLPELERLAKADAKLAAVATCLLEKQGEIALQQGRQAEAAAQFSRFLEVSLAGCDASYQSASYATALRAYREVAGASDEPIPLFVRGIAFGTEALARDPTDDQIRYEWCRLLLAYAATLRWSGRNEEAMLQHERVLAALERISTDPAQVSGAWLRVSAEAFTERGIILHNLGEASAARDNVAAGLQIRARLAEQSPADSEARFELMRSYGRLADLFGDAAQLDEAKGYYRDAVQQGELLAAMDRGCLTWHADRFSLLQRLASVCLDANDVDGARPAVDQAVTLAQEWAARETSAGTQMALFYAQVLSGKISIADRQWNAAAEAYQGALTVAEAMQQRDPQAPLWIARVAEAHDALGYCARRLDDMESALEHRRLAMELFDQVSRLQPDVVSESLRAVQAKINCAWAYYNLRTSASRELAANLVAEAKCTLYELEVAGKLTGLDTKRRYLAHAIETAEGALSAAGAEAAQPLHSIANPE